MIIVNGKLINNNKKFNYETMSIQNKVLNIMSKSNMEYVYSSFEELKFDLDLKNAIVESSRELYDSDVEFKTFYKSKCNSKYWIKNKDGGFSLKENVSSYDAIMDIFNKGSKYGTECATAMIIVYYRALTKLMSRDVFNSIYTEIELMNWSNIDEKLGVDYYDSVSDFMPGDCIYFKNPDVNPKTPEWQGENTIDLGDGTYFGHGLGIMSGEKIIDKLNKYRKKHSKVSAYVLQSVTCQGGKYLYKLNEKTKKYLQI